MDVPPINGEKDEASVVALEEMLRREARVRNMVAGDACAREVGTGERKVHNRYFETGEVVKEREFALVAANRGYDAVADPVERMGEPHAILEHEMPTVFAGEARHAVNTACDRR